MEEWDRDEGNIKRLEEGVAWDKSYKGYTRNWRIKKLVAIVTAS